MSTKKQLEEISAALNNASKLHKEQSGKLKGMAAKMKDDAKLEQARYKTKSVVKPKVDQSKEVLNQVSSAYLAGGNRPMNQIGTVQTGDTNAPNMGNFGGAMGMSGVPTRPIDPMTGMPMNYGMMQEKMSDTEKAAKIDAIPGMPEKVKDNMKANIDQQRKKYGTYTDFEGIERKATIDDSTFRADSSKYAPGGVIQPNLPNKYRVRPDQSYGYNKRFYPKGVEFIERTNPGTQDSKEKIDQVRLSTRIENTAKDLQRAFDKGKTIEKLGKETGKFGSNMGTILPEIEITESKEGKYRAVKKPLFPKIGQDAKQRKSMRVKRKK